MSTHSSSELLPAHQRRSNSILSASSRKAWEDDDNGHRLSSSSSGRLDTAQGHTELKTKVDNFDDNDQITSIEAREGGKRVAGTTPDSGLWPSVKRFLSASCRTRQTVSAQKDQDVFIKTTIRELIVFILFLIILCIVTFSMISPTMFIFTQVMRELFTDQPLASDTILKFNDISNMNEFWQFMEGPFLRGLYWEDWYNAQNLTNQQKGFVYYENKILGLPQLRQLRVRNDSCRVPDDFINSIHNCFAEYSESNEDHEPFGLKLGSAWNYQSSQQLDGMTTWGKLGYFYSGGGFVQLLNRTRDQGKQAIDMLKNNLWTDRATRAVFIDFTVYNTNVNLFCIVRLMIEFPATGGLIASSNVRTVKLLRYVTPYDQFVMVCEVIFCVFIFYYVIEEIIEIKVMKWKYLKNIWNYLDIVIIILSATTIAFNVYRTLTVQNNLEQLLRYPNQYPAKFEFLAHWQSQFNYIIAVVVFFSWMKIFKYISFNRTMTQLTSTLGRCTKDILGFAIMFFIIFFAYAQLAYLAFGNQVRDFSTFHDCIYTLFRIILGDFNFSEIERSNRVLGPIFFISYVFFVFFVLLNMFLAIINDTYTEVKTEIMEKDARYEIADYIKKHYSSFMHKLLLKKDRVVDQTAALKLAHPDDNSKVDYDEWQSEDKDRDPVGMEMDAVIAKYDLDGDPVHDEQERSKAAADLQAFRIKLDDGNRTSSSKASKKISRKSSPSDIDSLRDTDSYVSVAEFNKLEERTQTLELMIQNVGKKIDCIVTNLKDIGYQNRSAATSTKTSKSSTHTSLASSAHSLQDRI